MHLVLPVVELFMDFDIMVYVFKRLIVSLGFSVEKKEKPDVLLGGYTVVLGKYGTGGYGRIGI